MAALLHPQLDPDDLDELELGARPELGAWRHPADRRPRPIESGGAPARPRLALVGEPRAAVRRSPRTSRATYRRRRIVAALVVVGSLVAVGKVGTAFGGAPLVAPERTPTAQSAAAGAGAAPAASRSWVVEPGDTLWSIAARLAPGADPRPVVDALARDHGDGPLLPGEVVRYRG